MARDKFISRFMIPILDKEGKVVGFTGRVLPNEKNKDRPKYLNSPDSDIFKKGNLWYGYHLAIKTIRQKKWVILVEGNMDVIAANGYNICNVIASQGTSVTNAQIKILKQSQIQKIVIAFDNDNAGILSGQKLFKTLSINDFVVYKLIIPKEFKDLDEYLSTFYAEKTPQSDNKDLSHLDIDSFPVVDYLEWELSLITNDLLSTKAEVVRASINNYLQLLTGLNSVLIEQYLNKIASITSFSINSLRKLFENIEKKYSRLNEMVKIDSDNDNADDRIFDQLHTRNQIDLNKFHSALTIFQTIAAVYYRNKLESKFRFKMYFLFRILKYLFISSGIEQFEDWENFTSLEDYIVANKDLLELIFSQKLNIENTLEQNRMWNSLVLFIDNNYDRLIFDKELKENYFELKTRV